MLGPGPCRCWRMLELISWAIVARGMLPLWVGAAPASLGLSWLLGEVLRVVWHRKSVVERINPLGTLETMIAPAASTG